MTMDETRKMFEARRQGNIFGRWVREQLDQVERQPCPIENPFYCLGARCQLSGVCDHNRRLEEMARPAGETEKPK